MIARFTLPLCLPQTFSNIVDLDLCFYADRSLSNIPVDEFTVSFAYDYLLDCNETDDCFRFAEWWKAGRHFVRQIPIPFISTTGIFSLEVFNDDGKSLCKGSILEWTEGIEKGEISICCSPRLTQQLDLTYNNNDTNYYTHKFSKVGNMSVAYWQTILSEYFEYFWNRVKKDTEIAQSGGFDINFQSNEKKQYKYMAEIICNAVNPKASGQYYIQIKNHKATGNSFRNFLKELSKILMSRLEYNESTNTFNILSFDTDPVVIDGYIKTVKWNPNIDIEEFEPFVKSIEIFNSSGTKVCSVFNDIKNIVVNNLSLLGSDTEYEIWGSLPETTPTDELFLLKTGMKISLNNKIYTIIDISYEYETIDTIKAFTATCVRK